jgi:hypothetical protein
MIKYSSFLLFFSLLFNVNSYSQKKVLNAVASGNITIDGNFDEPIWEFAPKAKDFVMFYPDNGKPIDDNKKTEVQIAYNDDAIYIVAKMYDDEPSKILREIRLRDNFGTADHFGIFINGFNDSQQDFRFFVSASGVQIDCIFTNKDGEDFTWDAIWESKVVSTDYGWAAEIKIPYAALRFSKTEKQTWGINFYREIRRDRQSYTWNFIDTKIDNESAQSGILEGIDNIKTPTRLFLIPYSSFYLNSNRIQKTRGEIKGGLDIKYGISDAFTLDAILVPDFGQTKFDNVELYLGPFEQQFNENRPFFTEGTDLFNIGDLVYSRRIGEVTKINVADNEEIEEYPNSIKLINALKISGRTKSGLGIGVLNAITENTSVQVKNTDNNTSRLETLQPLSNYNVMVLDQRFRKNSSISLINTNVLRNGSFRDANVTAGVFDLNTKQNTYNLKGDFKYSFINDAFIPKNKKGYNTSLLFAETSGKFRFKVKGQFISKDYDINDLGINFRTHYHTANAEASYRIINPTKRYNSLNMFLNADSEFENKTGRVQNFNTNLSLNFTDKLNDYYGVGTRVRPLKVYDFYEALSQDDTQFIAIPENIDFWFFFSSNYNRKFALDINPTITLFNENKRIKYGFFISPRYRFNDRFSLIYEFDFSRLNDNIGNTFRTENDNFVFTRRDIISYSNKIEGKYSVNNRMNFNLSARHYWSYATNREFLNLKNDGTLEENTTYTNNLNQNLNLWNFDLSYNWWFAPGSQVTILYRNNAALLERQFSRNIDSNFTKAIDNENLNHIFSISLRYFIDYNSLKKK